MRQGFRISLETFGSAMRTRRLTSVLIVANLCLLTLYLSGWTHSNASLQDNKKTVDKHFAPKNEPIEITETKSKAKEIKLGESFEDESDWLQHVTFKVKNKSDKVITFLQIDLDFPETKITAGVTMMHQILLGRRPDFASTLKNQPLSLKPNEMIEIGLGTEYDDIKALIELKQSIGKINRLTIRTSDILFDDGSLYSGGSLFKRNPDPDSPQKWIRIDADTPSVSKQK